MWLLGGMCGLLGGAWLSEDVWSAGGCVVAGGMHAWLRGVHVCGGGVCRIRRDMVNERAVRILLECILAKQYENVNNANFGSFEKPLMHFIISQQLHIKV